MHFFRSEEHLRNWADFSADKEEGTVPLPDLVKLFSCDFFRRRLDPDYISHMQEYAAGFLATLKEIGKTGPYWLP
jgi:hypothetical protein